MVAWIPGRGETPCLPLPQRVFISAESPLGLSPKAASSNDRPFEIELRTVQSGSDFLRSPLTTATFYTRAFFILWPRGTRIWALCMCPVRCMCPVSGAIGEMAAVSDALRRCSRRRGSGAYFGEVRSESTSSLRSGRFDGAQNDLPKVLRSRVQLAHSGLTQRWRRSEKPGIAPVVRQH